MPWAQTEHRALLAHAHSTWVPAGLKQQSYTTGLLPGACPSAAFTCQVRTDRILARQPDGVRLQPRRGLLDRFESKLAQNRELLLFLFVFWRKGEGAKGQAGAAASGGHASHRKGRGCRCRGSGFGVCVWRPAARSPAASALRGGADPCRRRGGAEDGDAQGLSRASQGSTALLPGSGERPVVLRWCGRRWRRAAGGSQCPRADRRRRHAADKHGGLHQQGHGVHSVPWLAPRRRQQPRASRATGLPQESAV